MVTIRAAQWPEDVALLSDLDAAFVTDRIYRAVRDVVSFRLEEVCLATPLRKVYPFDPSDAGEWKSWDFAVIAERAGVPAGFAAAKHSAWNRSVGIEHLYVSGAFRRQGVGTALLEALTDYARSVGARCLRLETQNVNTPAIQFYRRSGFDLCGFDADLYDPAEGVGDEVALYFSCPVAVR